MILNASKLRFDGVLTEDKSIFPKGRYEVPSPERGTEFIEIRGRDGDLTKKYGYKDIPLTIRFYIKDKSFKKTFRKVKGFLLDAKTLEIDDDDDIYYKIKSVNIPPAENLMRTFGEFDVELILDPFQYEKSNNAIGVTSSTTINNDGYDCLPIVKVVSEGTGKIYINDDEIHVNNVNGTLVIDSEQMNAYRPGNPPLNANNRIEGDFPIIKNGKNTIKFSGSIKKLEITLNKRWR